MTASPRFSAPATLFGAALAALLLLAAPLRAEVELYEAPEVPLPESFQEPPSLQEKVAGGALAPVSERLPAQPRVVETTELRQIGESGGALHTMVGRAKDTRLLAVYGYARLVVYNEELELEPDIARSIEVEDGRIFTITLREGHRWSDGAPFTAEDFRYWWEDVANNEDLSPSGPPKLMLAGGEPPLFEVLSPTKVRYSWAAPNPYFLPALAGASPLFIYRPAHYMKRFHAKYQEEAELQRLMEENHAQRWGQLHNRLDNLYRFDNPDLPTLQPWMNTTAPPSQRFVGQRNPYYHRVDASGQQLPYIDEFILDVVNSQLIPAKTGAGDSDLQARGINFSDFTFLKAEEEAKNFDVRLWRTVRGSEFALYPNLNTTDEVMREILRDVRFRRALSLGIDREEINQLIYLGLGLPGNQSVLPGSPLYKPEYREAWAGYDPEKANALLDEMGLTDRNDEGIRLLPDGRPLAILVESAGENTQETDVAQLIHDQWKKIGVKLHIKPSQREMLRNRIFSGETMMTLWPGYENAVPTAGTSPGEFAPTTQSSYQWPMWGQYYETSGLSGEPIDLPEAEELMELYHQWAAATTREARLEAWERMLEINAEQVYTIGLVAQIPQPVVVSRKLHNVPVEGIFNWDPGAQFGMYRPDSFWFDKSG